MSARRLLPALVAVMLALAGGLRGQVQLYSQPGPSTQLPHTSGLTAEWDFQNTGSTNQTLNLSCYASGQVSSCSVSSSLFLPGFSVLAVRVTYSTFSPGTGTLQLYANCVSCSFSYQGVVTITVKGGGPHVVSVPTNGDYRDVTKCVANCFDAVASYSTTPYFSADVPRSVQLTYRSSQAHPMGVVQVDAVDTTAINPTKMSIQLYTSQATLVTFTNGSKEIFYNWVSHPADSNVNRLAAEFDASSLTTGAYNYTAVVRSYRSDGSFVETDVPVRLLVANEVSSPLGAGWSIDGFQRFYPNGAVLTEGNGSIAYFSRTSTSCSNGLCSISYASPNGDFTTLTGDSAYGGGIVYCPYPKTTSGVCRRRIYPDGSYVMFDPAVGMTVAYDSLGNATTFGYNASNLLVAIKDPTGKADSLGYDANNHLRWIKDPGGRVDSITIDGSGNLTQIRDPLRGLPFQVGTYDSQHRLIGWTDRRGGRWGLAYDFAGKVVGDTAPQITANGQPVKPVVTYASLEKSVLIDTATHLGSSSNPGPNVDTAMVRAKITNARGYSTTYALDRFGAANLIQEPLGRTTSFTRDSNSAVVRNVLPSGHVIKYTWSGPDLTQTVDSTDSSRTIHYTYTGHHLATVYGDVDSAVNVWTNAQLDSSHIGGSGWTKFTYLSGRLCNVVDPGAHRTDCHFTSTSGFQNTDSISNPLGSVGYRYDGFGQRVKTIDQVGDTTQTVYDSIGRVVRTIGPLHESDTVFYNGLYVIKHQDPKGQTHTVWPNALGWADSTMDPAGNKDRYQYDLNGNRTSWTNRNGQTMTYTYDSLDQMRSMVAGGKTTTYFYDPAGRYNVTSDSESTDTLKFDAADRPALAISCRVLASGNAPQCFRDSSVYEKRDMRTQAVLTAPGKWGSTQFIVGHHYDVHQLLDTLTPGHLDSQTGQPIAFVYSVEALDSVRTLTGLNNLTMTHSYPWTHRTDQVQLSDPTLTATLGTAYYFDNAGRVATRYHGSVSSPNGPDTTRTFLYSRQGSLVWYADTSHQTVSSCSWVCGGYYCTNSSQPSFVDSTRYWYDSVGNRKDSPTQAYSVDLGNRLRRWQNFRMDYDAAGNMTVRRTLNPVDTTRLFRTDSLFWSSLGRLDSVRTHDSTGFFGRVGFGYDGSGRRVRKSTWNSTGFSNTSRYLWDGDALLTQLDTLGNRVAGYTYYPGEDNVATVLRHDRADSSYYYVQDHSRNVLALVARTNAGLTIDNQYRYDPFGNLQGSSSSNIPNSLQLAGREYDAETQLYYDRARYIDPALGRFVSEDPIGLAGGINLYAFVGNDPVNGWDPSGTKCKDFSTGQEYFRDKFLHVAFGLGVVELQKTGFPEAPRWTTIVGGFWLGVLHEGPWGKKNTNSLRDIFHGWLGDHDWTDAVGAPCTGLFDTFFFMIPGIWYTAHIWPLNSAVFPGHAHGLQEILQALSRGYDASCSFPSTGLRCMWPKWVPFPMGFGLPPTVITGLPGGISY